MAASPDLWQGDLTDLVPRSPVVVGVGAVVWNRDGEVLLIRRANPPRQGEWSLPGGKLEPGERLEEAARREVREETGLDVEILGLIDVAELIAPGHHYVLVDYSASAAHSDAMAGSDAAEVRWVSVAELAEVPLWDETRRMIHLSAEKHGGSVPIEKGNAAL